MSLKQPRTVRAVVLRMEQEVQQYKDAAEERKTEHPVGHTIWVRDSRDGNDRAPWLPWQRSVVSAHDERGEPLAVPPQCLTE